MELINNDLLKGSTTDSSVSGFPSCASRLGNLGCGPATTHTCALYMIHWYKTFWKSESWKVSLILYFFFLITRTYLKLEQLNHLSWRGNGQNGDSVGTCQLRVWQWISFVFATNSVSDLGKTLSFSPACVSICSSVQGKGGTKWFLRHLPS